MVLDGGRILLDRDFDVDSLEQNQHKSAAEAIHRIITQGTANEIGDSTLRIFKSDSVEDLEHNDNKSIDNGSKAQTNRSKCGNIRLWQVLPLLERLHLECPPSKQDVMVLPFCYLAISLWGSFDSANPLQGKVYVSNHLIVYIIHVACIKSNTSIYFHPKNLTSISCNSRPNSHPIDIVSISFDYQLGHTQLSHLGFRG